MIWRKISIIYGNLQIQIKKPSYDDDFDSDEDDEVPEPTPAKKPAKQPTKQSNKVEDESEDDSDFEDPDSIQIPGEIKPLKSGDSATSMPTKVIELGGKHIFSNFNC